MKYIYFIGNSTCFQQVDQGHVCNDTKSSKNMTTNPLMKFFYDQELKKCSSFLYHGCGGNDNRFDEENQCVEKCATEMPTIEQGRNFYSTLKKTKTRFFFFLIKFKVVDQI